MARTQEANQPSKAFLAVSVVSTNWTMLGPDAADVADALKSHPDAAKQVISTINAI